MSAAPKSSKLKKSKNWCKEGEREEKAMKGQLSASSRGPVKFRMPTAQNLVPIRLDLDIDGQRFKDCFTWNPSDPDSEIVVFAKRTAKDLKLPPGFITGIASAIQSQIVEFRSFEGQDMYTVERIVPIKLDLRVNRTVIRDQFLWVSFKEFFCYLIISMPCSYNVGLYMFNGFQDLNNFESDPEEFAKTFCADLGIQDPEVGPAIAFSIREQLYEIVVQSVASVRETRINKKGRRGAEYTPVSKVGSTGLDLVKLFGHRSSVVRKRKEWDVYEPIVDLLSTEEVEALQAKEERIAR
ncbi:chromatin structure-remodeling complex protein BSH isoform X1 [Pyrus x bretschneideri]|uniref:chromatin structure-remodeling complex protein BSH isoform X1 n=1 Tax=Pyrus x bretschneideri TaxID=225117 RepID=UPI00051188C9|nr:chromatin structure-remodeling complex protein BSH isoform X1 [Pyrus x bretschneideri]